MSILYKHGLVIWVILALVFSQKQAFAQDYTFTRIEGLADQEIGATLLAEVYKIAGYGIDVVPLPGERAIQMSTSGYYDGESLRVFIFGETFPHMFRVKTPIYHISTVAISKTDQNFTIKSLDDLVDLNVLRVNGVIHSKTVSENLPHISAVTHIDNMFQMLYLGRGDVALSGEINGRLSLTKNNMVDMVTIHSPPILKQDLYHYIHVKNIGLGKKINLIVKKLITDGELQQMTAEIEDEYFSRAKLFKKSHLPVISDVHEG